MPTDKPLGGLSYDPRTDYLYAATDFGDLDAGVTVYDASSGDLITEITFGAGLANPMPYPQTAASAIRGCEGWSPTSHFGYLFATRRIRRVMIKMFLKFFYSLFKFFYIFQKYNNYIRLFYDLAVYFIIIHKVRLDNKHKLNIIKIILN